MRRPPTRWRANALLLLAVLVPLSAVADTPTVQLTADGQKWSALAHVDYLVDPDGSMTIDTVVAAPPKTWQRAPAGGLSLGPRTETFWLRIHAHNLGPDRNVALNVWPSLLDHLDLWQQRDDGSWHVTQHGRMLPYAARPHHSRDLVFSIPMAAGQSRALYFRLKTETTTAMFPTLPPRRPSSRAFCSRSATTRRRRTCLRAVIFSSPMGRRMTGTGRRR